MKAIKRYAFHITIGIALVITAYQAANACSAFFKYERTSGMSKICFYEHLNDEVAITISSVELCPLTIHVPH